MSNIVARTNQKITNMEVYASKKISSQAKKDKTIANLSFGEPVFGPPEQCLKGIEKNALTMESFMNSAKRYEDPQGSLDLRTAISNWYKNRYDVDVCPEHEIMITHGGVEAITLSILCTSNANDSIGVFAPSYMLYERAISTLERNVRTFHRAPGGDEFAATLEKLSSQSVNDINSIIINSPENPSGYVLSQQDWASVTKVATESNTWVIHDEVYDAMDFERKHIPAVSIPELRSRTIMINSFSKKFGLPGLRIGWLVAPKEFIELAKKAHDYLYLGVNAQYEEIAKLILQEDTQRWLEDIKSLMQSRANHAVTSLTVANGFEWPRPPLGAMFLFPKVRMLYAKLPVKYQGKSVSESVAQYLLKEKKVAVVPGRVYGDSCDEFVRLVLCTPDDEFNNAIERLMSC